MSDLELKTSAPVSFLPLPEKKGKNESLEYCRENSVLRPLLSAANQRDYDILLEIFGLDFERNYQYTQRMGADNPSEVRQTNLDHLQGGLILLRDFRERFEGVLSLLEEGWEDVEWGWILHDIGEWGEKHDTTTNLKVDGHPTNDDLAEQERAIKTIQQITDSRLQRRSLKSYLRFEQREAQKDLKGYIVRLIDKIEAVDFMQKAGVWADWHENGHRDINEDLPTNSIGKMLDPAGFIHLRMQDQSGQIDFRDFILSYIRTVANDPRLKPILKEPFFTEVETKIRVALKIRFCF